MGFSWSLNATTSIPGRKANLTLREGNGRTEQSCNMLASKSGPRPQNAAGPATEEARTGSSLEGATLCRRLISAQKLLASFNCRIINFCGANPPNLQCQSSSERKQRQELTGTALYAILSGLDITQLSKEPSRFVCRIATPHTVKSHTSVGNLLMEAAGTRNRKIRIKNPERI